MSDLTNEAEQHAYHEGVYEGRESQQARIDELEKELAENKGILDEIAMAFFNWKIPISGSFSFVGRGAVETTKKFISTAEEYIELLTARWHAARDSYENLFLKCPKCDEGFAGTDYTGEAIDCHYCDAQGRITAAAYVDLVDRFQNAVGDAMFNDTLHKDTERRLFQCRRIIKMTLRLKEKYRKQLAEANSELSRRRAAHGEDGK